MQTKIIAVTKQPLHNQPPSHPTNQADSAKSCLFCKTLPNVEEERLSKQFWKVSHLPDLKVKGGIREGRMIAGPSSVQTPATQFNEIDRPPQSTTNNPTIQPASLFFSLTIWYKLGTTASSIYGWRFIPLCCNSILWVRANRSLSLLVQHTKRRLPVKKAFKGEKAMKT